MAEADRTVFGCVGRWLRFRMRETSVEIFVRFGVFLDCGMFVFFLNCVMSFFFGLVKAFLFIHFLVSFILYFHSNILILCSNVR